MFLCDGVPDCPNGEDEEQCSVLFPLLPANMILTPEVNLVDVVDLRNRNQEIEDAAIDPNSLKISLDVFW